MVVLVLDLDWQLFFPQFFLVFVNRCVDWWWWFLGPVAELISTGFPLSAVWVSTWSSKSLILSSASVSDTVYYFICKYFKTMNWTVIIFSVLFISYLFATHGLNLIGSRSNPSNTANSFTPVVLKLRPQGPLNSPYVLLCPCMLKVGLEAKMWAVWGSLRPSMSTTAFHRFHFSTSYKY